MQNAAGFNMPLMMFCRTADSFIAAANPVDKKVIGGPDCDVTFADRTPFFGAYSSSRRDLREKPMRHGQRAAPMAAKLTTAHSPVGEILSLRAEREPFKL
jgi:hypothetical protein